MRTESVAAMTLQARRKLSAGQKIVYGVRPEHLNLERLVARVSEPGVAEVILALNATVDGQTTAHYITELLAHLPIKVTKLAHGVPVGGELDYLDEGTLSAAIRQRTSF